MLTIRNFGRSSLPSDASKRERWFALLVFLGVATATAAFGEVLLPAESAPIVSCPELSETGLTASSVCVVEATQDDAATAVAFHSQKGHSASSANDLQKRSFTAVEVSQQVRKQQLPGCSPVVVTPLSQTAVLSRYTETQTKLALVSSSYIHLENYCSQERFQV